MHTAPAIPEAWGFALLFSLVFFIFLAATALPVISCVGLLRTAAGGRSLYERCARQMTLATCLLSWLVFVLCGGLLVAARQGLLPAELNGLAGLANALTGVLADTLPGALPDALAQPVQPVLFSPQLLLAACGLLLAGLVLASLVAALRKKLRSQPGLFALFALTPGLCFSALAAVLLMMLRALPLLADAAAPLGPAAAVFLAASPSAPLCLGSAALLFLALAAAASFALLWLLLRRKRDDYGRDYYSFAAAWCGKWGAFGGWASLACWGLLGGLLFTAGQFAPTSPQLRPQLIQMGGLGASLFIASLIWTVVGVSTVPMRHKPGMIFAVFCLLAALTCLFLLGH